MHIGMAVIYDVDYPCINKILNTKKILVLNEQCVINGVIRLF